MTREEILKSALIDRDQEIMGYQINIDNYRLAIDDINNSGDEDLFPFRAQLVARLESETLEQKKAKLIRKVIAKQLGE